MTRVEVRTHKILFCKDRNENLIGIEDDVTPRWQVY